MIAANGVTDADVVFLSEVRSERVDWLWRHRIPRGELTIIDGDPGVGKSTLGIEIAATISTGRPWCDGAPCEKGCVLLFSAEDSIARTIRPRLEAAGAELTLVAANRREITLPKDIGYIRNKVEKLGVLAIVIDPFMAFLAGNVNSWKDQDVRTALRPLQELANERNLAVIIIRHLNKGGGGNALYRGGGSIGIIGAARAGFLVETDPDDESVRVLASVKSNLGPKPPALAFKMETIDGEVNRIQWLGASTQTAASLLAAKDALKDDHGTVAEAKALLLEIFGNDASVDARDAQKQLTQAGISEATVRRARQALGIQTRKSGYGASSRWRWFAPSTGFDSKASAA